MFKLLTLISFLVNISFLNASFLTQEDYEKAVTHSIPTVIITINGLKDMSITQTDFMYIENPKEVKKIRKNKVLTAINDLSIFHNQLFNNSFKIVNICNCNFELGGSLNLVLGAVKNISNLSNINFFQTFFGNRGSEVLISQLQGLNIQVSFVSCDTNQDNTLKISQALPQAVIQ